MSQWGEFRLKNTISCFHVFFIKFGYLPFLFFPFDEISDFRNGISTNQKLELVIRTCRWNCMLYLFLYLPISFLKSIEKKISHLWGCSFDIASSYFFRQSKVRSMLHHGSLGTRSEKNKRNLTLRLTLNLLLPSIVFYNKICVLIIIFTALSFLRLIHGLFLIWGGNVS